MLSNSIMPTPFISLFFIISLLYLPQLSLSQQPPPPRATLIDCGATKATTIDDRQWVPDDGFIFSGTKSKEFEAARFETDLEVVTRLLIGGREAVESAMEEMGLSTNHLPSTKRIPRNPNILSSLNRSFLPAN